MAMKVINVSELKAYLSKYLRIASRGAQIIARDRDEPIAQRGPPHAEARSWRDRLAREGRLRVGTQSWADLKISKLGRRIDIPASLRAVREDPNEVRRR